jgi:hypothetical protein
MNKQELVCMFASTLCDTVMLHDRYSGIIQLGCFIIMKPQCEWNDAQTPLSCIIALFAAFGDSKCDFKN